MKKRASLGIIKQCTLHDVCKKLIPRHDLSTMQDDPASEAALLFDTNEFYFLDDHGRNSGFETELSR